MFPFKKTLTTKNTSGKNNSKSFIIIHHTGSQEGSLNGVLNTLTTGAVSCHFVIDTDGLAYKINDIVDVLWHAGVSQWGSLQDMNKYALGIEVIGPLKDGGFTKQQKDTVKLLVQHLMAVCNIPKENVLKHCDLTWAGSKDKKHWDYKSASRKIDIARSFFTEYKDWTEYQNSLTPKIVG